MRSELARPGIPALLGLSIVSVAVMGSSVPGTGDRRVQKPAAQIVSEDAAARRPGIRSPAHQSRKPAPDFGEGVSPVRRHYPFVSADRMLSDLRELTAIGGDGLYRTSGSRGEREAFDWLAERLSGMKPLEALGASVERTAFRLPLATEVRRAELAVTISGAEFQVPAHALQGHREDLSRALRYDSDGRANDDVPDPVVRTGNVRVIRQSADLLGLPAGSLRGRVALVDFALLDTGILSSNTAGQAATVLLQAEPAALVLVTQFSNVRGTSHGSFLGDVGILANLSQPDSVPTLFVRLEDLAGAGIRQWSDLERVTRASMTWDADVFSPASSQYLTLRIPGEDSTRAVLLGAHLDSANSPGAMDDGSGVVALLEAARFLGDRGVRPPVDVHILWFGSHERGLYGSSVFAQSHAELLHRTIGMLEVDCLTHPLDGLPGELVVEAQSYRALEDTRLPFLEALARHAGRLGVTLGVVEAVGAISDNSSVEGFGVPNADAIYYSLAMNEVHVEGHLHDPYDDMFLAEQHRGELADMATVALAAVLYLPLDGLEYRVTPAPTARAVFVASHTEAVSMTPAHQSLLGMVLSWEGWRVEVVPYGTPVTDAGLEGAALVVALPVVDYPSSLAGPEPYDESWSTEEIDALRRYAERGGFLVLSNSAARLRNGTTPVEANEDWTDVNTLGAAFGITFEERLLSGTAAPVSASHPLVSGLSALGLAAGNGRAVAAPEGLVLARAETDAAAALVPVGSHGGEVLALADHAILGGRNPDAPNLLFFRNLARYGRARVGR